MARPYLLLLLLLPLLTVVPSMQAASQISPLVSLPDCRNKCGNITVPYPFGFENEPNCFREGFSLFCNESYNPPRLFIVNYLQEISDISPSGEMHIWLTAKVMSPYLLSVSNSFFAVGCPNQGYFVDYLASFYVSGCVSVCPPEVSNDWSYSLGSTNGSCPAYGCCSSSIPNGLNYYEPYLRYFELAPTRAPSELTRLYNPTNCSYVFLADPNRFHFNKSYLTRIDDFKVQVSIDWAVRNVGNCSYARRNMIDFACRSANHDCYNSDNGPGYLCKCSEGYQGNPYITGGCQDINECELDYPCYGDCVNMIGSYNCTCRQGTEGDALMNNGCHKKDNFTLVLKIITGASVGVFLVGFASFWLYLGMKKRRLIRTRQQFFEQNGGVLLRQQMSYFKTTTFKIYTKEELEKATNKFSEERVLGRGGHGIVYKGILDDGTVTAIKRSKLMEEQETKEFAKEMLILAQINRKNVVKLLGCCLEVEVPILVYEYISNGTLYHYIHKNNINAPIPKYI